MELKAYLAQKRALIEEALTGYLPEDERGGKILEAMRYSLFAGGKRLRPILCLAGAEAVGGDPRAVVFCALALEMVHTYSLIHDDLPAMDDDDLRRGRPTCHKVFGEGLAVLAGDGLLTEAMVLFCEPRITAGHEPARVLKAARVVMTAAGYQGMVGGQSADLLAENQTPDLATVQLIHALKTGALIAASLQAGAILAGASPEQEALLLRYGRRIGLAFQIADDLLDLEGDPATLGKAIKADQGRGKMTYPAVVGATAAREAGWRLVREAADLLRPLGAPAEPLIALALYIMERTS